MSTAAGSDAGRVACTRCGQDWQTWYRVRADRRTFLLCPECDAVWLVGEDRHAAPRHDLTDLFGPGQMYEAWDLIEPCEPPAGA
jgi:NAD-dependent SIR2 family protein deacetylase